MQVEFDDCLETIDCRTGNREPCGDSGLIIGGEFFGGKYGHRARSCWQCERRRKENGSQIEGLLPYSQPSGTIDCEELRMAILDGLIVN
ncbi:hypothetical protein F7R23_33415 [Burkholderia diffusa]|nr:hypothetical protein F7R23_33415 [Burkholderia diffusa]